ncbi:sigma-54-dependent Fis family transcriptional regulator [Nevskia sp.]|uniref:sigma-54-dependent Fis family transcriptional regulator n=1 Tax=Nevskia sp. TaxID=1929292 RepID=UPI0025F81E4F|nr:sigma-54-dependent Fis family transcriptional regulator [Nevskia sp.]
MGDNAAVQHANGVLRTINGGILGKAGSDDAIRVSWQRCLNDFCLDPARLHAPSVIDSNNLKDLQERHDELVEIARAEIDTLYDQISGSGYALLLTDAKGIILTDKVDPTLNKMFRSAGLLVGAEWSEKSEGTNGIGTCIAEGRSITVHRNDHFRARHIGLSCSGAPIRDMNGEMIAVLDASSVGSHDTRASQMHTMALVNTSARMIEKCLFLRRCQPYRVLRFHSRPEFVNLLHDAALALSEDGHIVAADDMAVSLLSAPSRASLIGRPVSELFDIGDLELAQLINTRQALMPVRDQRYGRRFFVTLAPPQLLGRIDSHSDRARRPQPERVQIAPAPSAHALSLVDLAGQDPQMLQNIRAASRLADSRVPILIQGPTGSGKEVFAKAVHLASSRAAQPFVAVNCGAIPETLIESELFGYKSGAFTGARKEGMRGRIQQSSGGTLFLDEIGDMPLNLQTRLLRVLEEQEVVPLGCEQAVKVELCVISASHRALSEMIAKGTFREDLYYRLNGMTPDLPALKDRVDAESLIRRFIALEARAGVAISIEADAFECLLGYDWPGNIRELRNVIRAALAICEDGVVRIADLPRNFQRLPAKALPSAQTTALPAPIAPMLQAVAGVNLLEAAEKAAILRAVETHQWNMTMTARDLGMSRNTLYRKLKRHAIPLGEARRDDLSRM